MGTNYVIHKDDQHEISIDEHSNRFTFMFCAEKKNVFGEECIQNAMIATGRDGDVKALFMDSTHYLTPEQLANIAINMLQISLYWHADNKAAHIDIQNRVATLIA